MNSAEDNRLRELGLTWMSNGQAVLSGRLLELFEGIDGAFVRLARVWNAAELRFPTFISAAELNRLDYFKSFPHLVTFPICLDAAPENLDAFTAGEVFDALRGVHLTGHAPIRDVLTPAACYHLYVHYQDRTFAEPRYFTVRNTCFRREEHYQPLMRQWSFNMREIVCVGSLEEVRAFLERAQRQVSAFLEALALPVRWQVATDPFFRPAQNPAYLMQRLNPTKQEAIFDGNLAISSVNLHQDHFGATFGLRRGDESAYSGCVAFGLERWVYAVTRQFPDSSRWPDFTTALDRALGAL